MARKGQLDVRHGALDLLEQAFHLLRTAPAGTLGLYCLGAMPFVLGLLYFFADMSRDPYAAARLAPEALLLALLLVWMKCWQSAFMGRLMGRLTGEASGPWGLGRILNLIAAQAAVQPAGLVVLPLAVLVMVPLPYAYAFYQNACLLCDGRRRQPLRQAIAESSAQAWRWQGGNLNILMLLALLGLVICVSLQMALTLPAQLAHMFLGIESVFTRGGFTPLNTTFVGILLALTYLVLDPLVKAVYVLRCFYGRSLSTGDDLRAELRELPGRGSSSGPAALALLAALLGSTGILPVSTTGVPPVLALGATDTLSLRVRASGSGPISHGRATTARPWHPISHGHAYATAGTAVEDDTGKMPVLLVEAPPDGGSVDPQRLDDSLREVTRRREYAWRMPRPDQPDHKEGWLAELSRSVRKTMRDLENWLKRPSKPSAAPGSSGPSFNLVPLFKVIVYGLLIAAVAVLGWLLLRHYRRQQDDEPLQAEDVSAPEPDLADENVSPAQLPADGWLDVARRMLDQGDRRLAMRALYLASLALLGQLELIVIARFKSNREYQAELRRRGHATGELVDAFGQNVGFFEDAWYGMHDVTDPVIEAFWGNQERIRRLAGQ